MNVWLYTIISVVVVSLLSLIGIFTLMLRQDRLKKILLLLVSFAVGGLFGDAIIHLLPESFGTLGVNIKTSSYIMSGILLFFVLEKILRFNQSHAVASGNSINPFVPLIIIGDTVHNLIDGMLIGASYSVNIHIGITTTIAVVLHEIPHEIGDFGVLVHGGLSVKKALVFNFLSALSAILGGIVSLLIGSNVQNYSHVLLPITAGGFLYIAGSDLMPELQQDIKLSKSIWQLVLIIFGFGIMSLLNLIN